MGESAGLLVIGGGQAGFQLAVSARAAGFAKPITIVCGEPELPYGRPPLSKAYLLGKQSRESLLLQKPAFYDRHRVDPILGRRAVRIDRGAARVHLDDGRSLPFAKLVIATGARNRKLALPGADLDGILGLRDLSDVDALRERLDKAVRVVVIGGGFIGLEFAAVARQLGKEVLVVEATDRLMGRAVPPQVSGFFQDLHEARGVRFATGATVGRFLGSGGRVHGVALGADRIEPADVVVVGIGVVPNDELAAEAGLAVGNGVRVDGRLATSDPRILAIGDCAAFPGPTGEFRRLESVQNAVDQGKHAARSLLGAGDPYGALPWFWSDQYDCKLQIAGLTGGADEVVLRGRPETRRFSAFSFKRGALIGVDSVNQPVDHAVARKLLSRPCGLSPALARDPDFDLRTLTRAEAA